MQAKTSSLEIVRMAPGLERQASESLARAFFVDPLIVYYVPDEDMRRRALPVFMRVMLRYTLAHGEVWTTPGLDGLACWLPPGRTELSNWGLARAALGVVPLRVGWLFLRQSWGDGSSPLPVRQLLERVSRVEGRFDQIHREIAPGPHWYLMTLAVEPARQGQGIGSRLIAPMLERARAANLPCYLETMTELDVAFYRKNGFQVAHQETIQPGDLASWALVRWPEDGKREKALNH